MKELKTQKNGRFDELNYFNAIACLFVILIHVLSLGITRLDPKSVELAAVYFPWKLAAYVVPGFLFTGAVKMALGFRSDKKVSYFRYMLRRITKIFVPYLVYVLLFYAYYIHIGWMKLDIGELFDYVIHGNIASPFYYIITVMQFYLLMPLWKLMVKHVPALVAIPSSALLTFVAFRLTPLLGVFGITYRYSDRVFPAYLFFWVVGLYAGKYYEKLTETLLKYKKSVLFCIVPAAMFSLLNLWQYRSGHFVYGTDANCMKMISDLLSIIFFLGVCLYIKESKLGTVKKVLSWIFASSFTVYLCHCLFLVISEQWVSRRGITDIGVLLVIRFAVCYTLPFLWYFVLNSAGKLIGKLKTK